jgi:hypothetical protein
VGTLKHEQPGEIFLLACEWSVACDLLKSE